MLFTQKCCLFKMLTQLPETLYTIGIYTDFDRRRHIQRVMDGWSSPDHNPYHSIDSPFSVST